MVISDLDGTIKDTEQPVHPYTIEVIKRLPEFGLHFTLASGRSLASLRPYAEALGVDIPMVLANGCLVQSLDGAIYHRITMPVEVTRQVMAITDREGSDMVVFSDDRLFYKVMTENIDRIFGKLDENIFEVGTWDKLDGMIEQVNKFMIIDWQDLDKLAQLETIFAQELEGKADFLRTNIHHLEVMPKDVTKVTGLEKLATSLGVRMNEIIAFGDFENDTAMLKEAGLGVAVANACDLAKAHADLIVGSCADNGPAQFLDQLMR
jgi:Cof subfamily protein (haloacid dehalogenase superfamily)